MILVRISVALLSKSCHEGTLFHPIKIRKKKRKRMKRGMKKDMYNT